MTNFFSFDDPKVGLLIFFMYPEITAHFSVVAEDRHPVLPRFTDFAVLFQNMSPHKLKTCSDRFILIQEPFINRTEHEEY